MKSVADSRSKRATNQPKSDVKVKESSYPKEREKENKQEKSSA
jgi:hypothetical protein